jgi:uncharacterized membrane protein
LNQGSGGVKYAYFCRIVKLSSVLLIAVAVYLHGNQVLIVAQAFVAYFAAYQVPSLGLLSKAKEHQAQGQYLQKAGFHFNA